MVKILDIKEGEDMDSKRVKIIGFKKGENIGIKKGIKYEQQIEKEKKTE